MSWDQVLCIINAGHLLQRPQMYMELCFAILKLSLKIANTLEFSFDYTTSSLDSSSLWTGRLKIQTSLKSEICIRYWAALKEIPILYISYLNFFEIF